MEDRPLRQQTHGKIPSLRQGKNLQEKGSARSTNAPQEQYPGDYVSRLASQRSASRAAMQPVPAAVIACR